MQEVLLLASGAKQSFPQTDTVFTDQSELNNDKKDKGTHENHISTSQSKHSLHIENTVISDNVSSNTAVSDEQSVAPTKTDLNGALTEGNLSQNDLPRSVTDGGETGNSTESSPKSTTNTTPVKQKRTSSVASKVSV